MKLCLIITSTNPAKSFYRNIDTQNSYKIDAIWDEAKGYICEAITAKRNATQTRIKKVLKVTNDTLLFYEKKILY